MVATVGSIAIELIASTAKFIAGFKNSATTVERESKRMSNSVNGFAKASKAASGIVSGFVGGIVAGGALAAIGSFSGALAKARQSLSDFEEIGNRAKATGLGTDTFQAISHGASLADVEQESLNKSLEIFAKNVGLAKDGSGNLYSSLIKLNPQLLQSVLHATDQETRLKLVANAMAQMTDATDKAALATAVFGRGGAEMVRVLDKGSESIEKMKRDAKDLGIIIPDDLIQKAGELDDKLTTLQKVIDVQLSTALFNAAPLLLGAATATATFAKELNQVTAAVNAFVSNPSLEEFGKLMSGKVFSLSIGGHDIVDIIKAVVPATDTAAEAQKRYSDEIRATHENLTRLFALQKKGFDVDQGIIEMLQRLNNLEQAWRDAGAAAKVAGDQMADATHSALRAADFAAMNAADAHRLPTVHHGVDIGGGNAIDPETGEKIEAAIAKETEATYVTGRYNRDAIGKLDANTAAHFDGLGSHLDSGFDRLIDATNLLPGKYSLAMVNALNDRSTFSGLGNSGSWAGRQFTVGGGGAGGGGTNPLGMAGIAGYYSSMGGAGAADASSVSGGGSGAINVSVTVRPILEGQRLSGQSSAEIKQAASAGANTALRAFYGR